MVAAKILFWFSLFIITYSYIGYGILLFFLTRIKLLFVQARVQSDSIGFFEPEVTLIVAAFNEEDCIEEKIRNTLLLDYPRQLIKFIIITDGSTDQTALIAGRYSEVQ